MNTDIYKYKSCRNQILTGCSWILKSSVLNRKMSGYNLFSIQILNKNMLYKLLRNPYYVVLYQFFDLRGSRLEYMIGQD